MSTDQTPDKPKRGPKFKPASEKLEQRSVRMLPAQWAKVDAGGGQQWLRDLVDQAPALPKKKPAE